jgi:hypothetical protein
MKKKEKIIEDKTFGLKNKKGSKQQKFIQHVQTQVTQAGKTAKQLEKEKADKMAKKDDKKKLAEELNTLFKPVEQKVAKGTDPKSVLCAFFKVGQCMKGDKCKFSHDLSIGRKGEKRSMYEDHRDQNENETMADWDEAKLEEVVTQKHAESDMKKPKTDIICKYFLEALETSKYGWFWQCPNGEACIYRHALPPGFVLKKDQKKDNKEDQISLEDLIERERAALSSQNLTKVTLETFLKWKERKRHEKADKAREDNEKKKANFSQGKMFGISGREMFEFNPDLVEGDDDEADDVTYQQENPDEDAELGPVREIDLNTFAEDSSYYCKVESPPLATTAAVTPSAGTSRSRTELTNGNFNGDENVSGMAATVAAVSVSDSESTDDDDNMVGATGGADPVDIADEDDIDENLFDGEDLDVVEQQLDSLEVVD